MTKLITIGLLLLAAGAGAEEKSEEAESPLHEAPTLDQTVPVAAEAEPASVDFPPEASDEDQLLSEYHRYLQLMADKVYDEADSAAKRVVELAIKVKGAKSNELAKALTNLAIVQHRTGQFDAAVQNFESAIEIIEINEDRLNEQLVNPLKGLGASQLENGRPDLATPTLQRAVHVTHVNEGPHNLEQVEILESLAEASLRLGSIDDARQIHDTIYALNQRAYSPNSLDIVPSLMRRAAWQHRSGLINDERATLRRVVRIYELEEGKDTLSLVEPLLRLGQSYFYVDVTGAQPYHQSVMSTGEIYFKRALRIASENPDENWEMVADTSLALGDYYMLEGNEQRASRVYKEAWQTLSDDDERLAYRHQRMEQYVALRERPIPTLISTPVADPASGQDAPLLQGQITVAYDVSMRGRVTNLQIIEARPAEFTSMQQFVQREMRSRVYRPRFVDGEAVDTEGQLLEHRFNYLQADLDAARQDAPAEPDQS